MLQFQLLSPATLSPVALQQLVFIITYLSRTTFHDTFYAQNTPADMALFLELHMTEEVIKAELLNPENYFVLAHNDQPVGYAKLSCNTNPFANEGMKAMEISRLYLLKEKIGKGAGRELMNFCLDTCRQRGYEVVWLGVWQHNARAIRFYQQAGFEKFGEHTFMLGTDAQTDWLMKKLA